MIKVKIIRESLREELLDEAREDDIAAKYKIKPNDSIWEWLTGWVGERRNQRLKYLEWATSMIYNAGYNIREVIDSLIVFEKFSGQMKLKNIKSYQSPSHLISAYKEEVLGRRVGKARKERGKSEERASEEDRSVIYEDEHLFVIRPHHVEASCHYGRKTKWCIAQPGNEYFDDYTDKDGKVFYFIKDDRRKSDDQYAKVAIQVGLVQRFQSDEYKVVIDGYWDRYDNEDLPIENRVPKPISELDKFFGDEIKKALDAITKHAKAVPPTFGTIAQLEKIDEEIYEGKFNRNNLNISSEIEAEERALRIDVNWDASMSLEELYNGNYEINDIRAAIEDYENSMGDLEDALVSAAQEYSYPLDHDNWYEQWEDGRVIHIDDNRVRIDLHYNSEYFDDDDDARTFLTNTTSEQEDMSNIWEAVRGFLESELEEFIAQDNLQAIRDIASGVDALDSKLKNLNVVYDESETEIRVFTRKGYEIPMQLKSFNMPVSGMYSNAAVTRQVGMYATAIRRALHPLKEKVMLAIDMAFNKLEDQFNKQTQLKFKGFDRQEPIKFRATNKNVTISTPDSKAIMGKPSGYQKPVEPMKISVGFDFVIDREYSVEDIKQSFRYITMLDTMVDDIIKMALSSFDMDEAYKQINDSYEQNLVRDRSVRNLKSKAGLEPEAYTESKKRKKFKVRILK